MCDNTPEKIRNARLTPYKADRILQKALASALPFDTRFIYHGHEVEKSYIDIDSCIMYVYDFKDNAKIQSLGLIINTAMKQVLVLSYSTDRLQKSVYKWFKSHFNYDVYDRCDGPATLKIVDK